METTSPYHAGEIAVHRRLGVERQAGINGKVVGPNLNAAIMKFIEIQPMVILASASTEGMPWASALFGKPGFVKAVHDHQLVIDLNGATRTAEDPLWENILHTGRVGLIIIELSTRRRVRINGSAVLRDDMIEITIEQAYPNCPKYIQRRQIGFLPERGGTKLISSGTSLLQEHWEWITHVDTLFVASMNQQMQLDASHRGGGPGFVAKLDDHTLQVPDYPGNSMFNTLGNFVDYPKAGLIFIDFLQAKTLQLTGEVEIVWDVPGADQITGGTKRLWNFKIHSFMELKTNKNFSWSFMEYSPFNPELGFRGI